MMVSSKESLVGAWIVLAVVHASQCLHVQINGVTSYATKVKVRFRVEVWQRREKANRVRTVLLSVDGL